MELPDDVITEEEYPAEFRTGHFDAALVFSQQDKVECLKLIEILTTYIKTDDDGKIAVCAIGEYDELPWITGRFAHLDEAIRRSTYVFIYLTKNFTKDSLAELDKDECLMKSVTDAERRWSVVPLYTRPKHMLNQDGYECPAGLNSLMGVDISQLVTGSCLEQVDINRLREDDLDSRCLNKIAKMLRYKIHLKKERERRQHEELERWLEMEKGKRSRASAEQRLKLDDIRRRELQISSELHEKLALSAPERRGVRFEDAGLADSASVHCETRRNSHQMSEADQKILQVNHVFLLDNLDPSQSFLGRLHEQDILTPEDMEYIQNNYVHPTTRRKVGKLLHLVCRGGPDAFAGFMRALDESGMENVADRLREGATNTS